MKKGVGIDELAFYVSKKNNISEPKAKKIIKDLIESIREVTVDHGDRVVLKGFGTFIHQDRVAYVGQNPKTMEPVNIPQSRSLRFRASPLIRKYTDPVK